MHNPKNSKKRAHALVIPLGDLVGGEWRLFVRWPPCREQRPVEVNALAKRYGRELRVRDLLPRFTCSKADPTGLRCFAIPERIILGSEKRSVILHGPDADE